MKKYLKKVLSVVLCFGIAAGSFAIAASSGKETVNAATSKKTLMMRYRFLVEEMNTKNAATVYYGKYGNKSLSWRVVGFNGKGVGYESNGSFRMTVLASSGIGPNQAYQTSPDKQNYYDGSNLQARMVELESQLFTDWERRCITSIKLPYGQCISVTPYTDGIRGPQPKNMSIIWPLSSNDAWHLDGTLSRIDEDWWLRSPGKYDDSAAYVTKYGAFIWYGSLCTKEKAMRPAMNICTDFITFASANGVISADPSSVGKLVKMKDYTDNAWKLSLNRNPYSNKFHAFLRDTSTRTGGDKVEFQFEGANVGTTTAPEFVSIILLDQNSTPVYYGHIACNKSSGKASFNVPSDLPSGKYIVKVFNDQCNSGYSTNYVSNLVSFDLDVKNPLPVQDLKAEAAGRNKVKLTWYPSKNADGYLIYARKKGEYVYVGMTTTGTTFTDTNALDTAYNFYWVYPYFTDENGKMIPGECPDYVFAKGQPLPVTGLRAQCGEARVTLTWDAMEGAEGYLIYAKRPGEEYQFVRMVSGTSYIDVFLTKDDYTYYWVYSYYTVDGVMVRSVTGGYVYSNSLPI